MRETERERETEPETERSIYERRRIKQKNNNGSHLNNLNSSMSFITQSWREFKKKEVCFVLCIYVLTDVHVVRANRVKSRRIDSVRKQEYSKQKIPINYCNMLSWY